jgi:hypothetical protein
MKKKPPPIFFWGGGGGGALCFGLEAMTWPLAPVPPCKQSSQQWGFGAGAPSPSRRPHYPPHEQMLMGGMVSMLISSLVSPWSSGFGQSHDQVVSSQLHV